MSRPRVLIVDDSAVVRRVISTVIDADPNLELAGSRESGRLALATMESHPPDVIILDVEMPEMDGIQVLEEMRQRHIEIPVFMFSSPTARSAQSTLDALSRGAIDFVQKPIGNWTPASARNHIQIELLDKITALFRSPDWSRVRRSRPPRPAPRTRRSPLRPQVLAIGCSTGGPNALATLVPALPADLPVPVLIVQHMPPIFTAQLAGRLNKLSALTVREAVPGAELRAGEAWVAPGGSHMSLRRRDEKLTIHIDDGPPVNSCRPSIDVLMSSVAEHYGSRALAVVMTGLGTDGLAGCERIHEQGGQILVQDRASSVIWGMPGAVFQAGIASRALPLDDLGSAIVETLGAGGDAARERSGTGGGQGR